MSIVDWGRSKGREGRTEKIIGDEQSVTVPEIPNHGLSQTGIVKKGTSRGSEVEDANF